MKKCLHLVILGLAFSLPAMSQTVFSCGFEDGETGYELTAVKAVRGGVSDAMTIADEVEFVDGADTIDGHHTLNPKEEFFFDVDGGKRYLQWQCAGNGSDAPRSSDESCLILKGFELKDNTTYRITYYISSENPDGKVQCGVYHGTADNCVPVSMDWETGAEKVLEFTNAGNYWKRVSYAFQYRSDSFYKEKKSGVDDADFIRISFMDAGNRYCIDAVSIEEECVETFFGKYGVYVIDLGYEINLLDFVDAGKFSTQFQMLPKKLTDCFSLTGVSKTTGNREKIDLDLVFAGEGYSSVESFLFNVNPLANLHFGFAQELEKSYDDCILTFRNSSDPSAQLRYTDSAFPNPEDAEWVSKGKAVPDFECGLKYMDLAAPMKWTPTKVQPQAESDQPYEVRHVDMLGRQVSPEAPGLHIILQSDGTAKKVFTK